MNNDETEAQATEGFKDKHWARAICIPILVASALGGLPFFVLFWLANFNEATSGRVTLLRRLLGNILSTEQHQFFIGWSKDASTITPIIGLIVFSYIVRASWRILAHPDRAGDQVERSKGKFPFPANYQVTWVQLGLLGTLYGFMLIGRELQSSRPEESVRILITAFDTALLSTFSGVIAAYVFGPFITGGFGWILQQADIRPVTSLSLIDGLKRTLTGLATSAESTSRSLSRDGERQPRTSDAAMLPLRESVIGLNEALTDLQRRVDEANLKEPIAEIVEETIAVVTTTHGKRVQEFEENVENRLSNLAERIGDGLNCVGEGLLHGHERLAEDMRIQLTELHQSQQRSLAQQHAALLDRIANLVNALREGRTSVEKSIDHGLENIAIESHRAIKQLEQKARQEQQNLLAEVKQQLETLSRKVARLERGRIRLTWRERVIGWLRLGRK